MARWADLREQGLQLGARAVGLSRMDDLHDKLPAVQKRVAYVLALPDGNGCVSHVSDSKTWRDDERGETRAGSKETGRVAVRLSRWRKGTKTTIIPSFYSPRGR